MLVTSGRYKMGVRQKQVLLSECLRCQVVAGDVSKDLRLRLETNNVR